jgi:hypothetical protein
MRSLREIISMNGIVVKEDIVIGNVRIELMKQIDSIKPGVIVLGRDTSKKLDTGGLLAWLVRKISTPVLVIPRSHNPRTSGRAVLKSEITTKSKNGVATLFEIIKKISNELSVLNIKSYFFSNASSINLPHKWKHQCWSSNKRGKAPVHFLRIGSCHNYFELYLSFSIKSKLLLTFSHSC